MISTENNYNNRKKKDQLGELDQNTSMAQQQSNDPTTQSLSQKQSFGTMQDSFANTFVKGLAQGAQPQAQGATWQDRQQEFGNNPVVSSILAVKPTPMQVQNIKGLDDTTNSMIQNIVAMKNAYRQDSMNKAQMNAISSMQRNETDRYNADQHNATTLSAYGIKQNPLDDMKKRAGFVDKVLANVNGFSSLDPNDESDGKKIAEMKAKYVQDGVLPTNIAVGKNWIGMRNGQYTISYDNNSTRPSAIAPMQLPQGEQQATTPATAFDEDFKKLKETGLNPKVRLINGKQYVDINGKFYEQRQ